MLSDAVSYDELFTSGVIRIDDENGRLFNFINSCDGVYSRASSHYGERLKETVILNPGAQVCFSCDLINRLERPRFPHGER